MAKVELSGFQEFQNKLKNLPKYVQQQADGFVEDAALLWEERAKLDAPVNFGRLRGSITVTKSVPLQREVVSPVEYSPYMEWGTGTRVKVPQELQSYAIQFKGKKSVIGVYPHPFFFIQKPIVEKQLFNDINALLSKGI